MGKMLSSKIRWSRDGVYEHWCPACKCRHQFYVDVATASTGAKWTWNGNVDIPTFSPSMHIYCEVPALDTEEEWERFEKERESNQALTVPLIRKTICHYFLTEGKLIYCGDSNHDMKNAIVDLPDWPQPYLDEWDKIKPSNLGLNI